MLEDVIIVGVVMAVAELIKGGLKKFWKEETVTQITPLIVLALAGGLNMANAAVFAPDTPLVQALGQGLALGAIASGLYSQGKAILGKS